MELFKDRVAPLASSYQTGTGCSNGSDGSFDIFCMFSDV